MKVQKTTYIHENGDGTMNEDTFFIGSNRFMVADGASDLLGYRDENGNTGGYLAAKIIHDTFESSNESLRNTILRANQNIIRAMEVAGTDTKNIANRWSAGCAAISLYGSSMNWVQVGDCPILAIRNDGSYSVMFEDYEQDEAPLSEWQKLKDKTVKEKRLALNEIIVRNRQSANTFYSQVNGDKRLSDTMKYGIYDLPEDIKVVLIMTDGMQIPKESIHEPDRLTELVDILLEKGLKSIFAYVRKLENDDPDCSKYVRYKKHDDATAIAVWF